MPDGKVGEIISSEIVPHLRNNDYATGLKNAVTAISKVVTASPAETSRANYDSGKNVWPVIIGFMLLPFSSIGFMIIVYFTRKGNLEGDASSATSGPSSWDSGSSSSSSGRSDSGFSGGSSGGGGAGSSY